MKKLGMFAIASFLAAGAAQAAGELNIYNWGNYTSPELIKKFEETYDVKVTITDYDSNTTALTKIEAGGHGFDIVVPTHSYMQIFIEKGLLMEPGIPEMENFKHISDGGSPISKLDLENVTAKEVRIVIAEEMPEANVDALSVSELFAFASAYAKMHPAGADWVNVDWDPGRRYSVPWQWGTTGVAVNKSVYGGDINTSAIWLDPPAELVGKVNVVPEMQDVVNLALMYVGGEPCTTDKAKLKEARDVLMAAKPKWMSMDYGMTEKLSSGDVPASVNWNGSTFRARNNNPDVAYGYPKEGYPVWMDSAAILADAQNVENAKLFLNFIMAPENAAMISAFARYANGIDGSEAFMPDDMKTAPEIVVPAELQAAGKFSPACSDEAQAFYTAIWTELQK